MSGEGLQNQEGAVGATSFRSYLILYMQSMLRSSAWLKA